MLRLLVGVSLIVMSLAGTAASAGIITLSATIDGAQANAGAGTGSTGTGTALLTLDTTTNALSWNVSWSGLTGPVVVMHFHGAATPFQNAGVQVDIGAISGLGSPSIGGTLITDLQEANLLAGLWYVNIHTAAFPGGEIRGQVRRDVPEPTPLSFLLIGMLLVGVIRYRPVRVVSEVHSQKV